MISENIFITMEENKRPYYFIWLNRFDPVNMIHYGEEYELDGINPERDQAIYKHRRRVEVPEEMIINCNMIEDPRR